MKNKTITKVYRDKWQFLRDNNDSQIKSLNVCIKNLETMLDKSVINTTIKFNECVIIETVNYLAPFTKQMVLYRYSIH